jgi:hypothetical protein
VGDQPGAGHFEQRERLAGSQLAKIGVAPVCVVAGHALLDVVLGRGKVREPGLRILGKGAEGDSEKEEKSSMPHDQLREGSILLWLATSTRYSELA